LIETLDLSTLLTATSPALVAASHGLTLTFAQVDRDLRQAFEAEKRRWRIAEPFISSQV